MRIYEVLHEETAVQQQPNDNTIDIPEWNVDEFKKRIDKINKKAGDVGASPVKVTELGSKQIPDPNSRRDPKHRPLINVFSFKVEGEAPKLAGWTFLGTLDHVSVPGQVIVQTVPGHQVPKLFFTAPAECDHCGKIRRRNETFVMQHDDGRFMKVGRMCLRDFLGHDPSRAIAALQAMFKLVTTYRNGGGWGGGGTQYFQYNLEEVLKVTAAVVARKGWVPKSAASEQKPSTASEVEYLVARGGSLGDDDYKQWLKDRKDLDVDNPKWEAVAKEAMEWLDGQDTSRSEYLHNLATIKAGGGVPLRLFGYWVSLVPAYQREAAKKQSAPAAAGGSTKKNEWAGKDGEKIQITATLDRIHNVNGYYGTVFIHNFTDDQGRTITWFASSDQGMETGKKYSFIATVKKLDEYKGWKQTHVKRPTNIKEIP